MRSRLHALFILFLLLLSFCAPAFADSYGSVSNAMNSVARVYTEGTVERYINNRLVSREVDQPISTGSAFAVGEKQPVTWFVTNRHVVADEESTYTDDNGNTVYEKIHTTQVYIIMDDVPIKNPATIVTTNEGASDLAILKLDSPTNQREPITLHPYTDPIAEQLIGSDVWAIGYPGISDYIYKDVKTEDDLLLSSLKNLRTAKGSFTGGIDASISSTGGSYIETNATISPGNSGGPLVDEKGSVLGVCTTMSTTVVGTNGAVSVNEVIKLLNRHSIPYLTAAAQSSGVSWYPYAIIGAAFAFIVILSAVYLLAGKSSIAAARGRSGQETGKPQNGIGGIAPTAPAKKPADEKRILYGISGQHANRQYTLRAGEKLRIGRDSRKCNVLFMNGTPGVSADHCMITFDGKNAAIMDLGSSCGTFVNGTKLEPMKETRLHRGGSIDIGSRDNRFTLQ